MKRSYASSFQQSPEVDRHVRRRIALLGNPTPRQLIELATDKGRPEDERAEAISLLGLLRKGRAATSLVTVLKENRRILSWTAAEALGQIARRTVVAPLLGVLRSRAPGETRQAAIHALGVTGDRRAAGALVKVLQDPSEAADVRGEAAEALAGCGLQLLTVLWALADALADPSPEVRFWAAFALGVRAALGGKLRPSELETTVVSGLRRLVTDGAVVRGLGSVGEEASNTLRLVLSASRRAGIEHSR